jgi:hypothetical protein
LGNGSAPAGPFGERLWGRMLDHLDTTLDGKSSWTELVLDRPDLMRSGRLYRFDGHLNHRVRLDDFSQIGAMADQARRRHESSPAILELARKMVINFFYFELLQDPEDVTDGRLTCRVQCRWEVSQRYFDLWRQYILSVEPQVFVNGRHYGTVQQDSQGNIGRALEIPYDENIQVLRVQMQFGSNPLFHVGYSPFLVSSARERQGFHDPFLSQHSSKRKRHEDENLSPRKKPRL